MNKNDAAAFLEVSIRTLENYVSANRINVRYVKGKTRPVADFDPEELARFKENMGTPISRVVDGTPHNLATSNNSASAQNNATSQGDETPNNSANPNNPANSATAQNGAVRNRANSKQNATTQTTQGAELARFGDVAGNGLQPILQIQPEHLQALLAAAVGQGSTMQELSVKPLLTFPEAAQLTGLSERSLRVAAKEGELKIKRMGRADRLLRTSLDQWLQNQFNNETP
jgi:excisionase family DNA binding protein